MPEAICCCLQTSTYICFCQGGEIYNYVEKLSFPKLLYFLSYNYVHMYCFIMYCQRLFLLFTCRQHCLHKIFFRGPTCDEYLSSCKIFKFGGVTVLAVQLFNKIKKKKKKTKNMKKQVSLYFRGVMSKYIYFW